MRKIINETKIKASADIYIGHKHVDEITANHAMLPVSYNVIIDQQDNTSLNKACQKQWDELVKWMKSENGRKEYEEMFLNKVAEYEKYIKQMKNFIAHLDVDQSALSLGRRPSKRDTFF